MLRLILEHGDRGSIPTRARRRHRGNERVVLANEAHNNTGRLVHDCSMETTGRGKDVGGKEDGRMGRRRRMRTRFV
jgi:hypothetical protein